MQLCRSSGSAVHQPGDGHKALSRNSFEIEWPEYLSELEMMSMKMHALPVNSAIVAFTLGGHAPAGTVWPAMPSALTAHCGPEASATHTVGGTIPRGQRSGAGCTGSRESGFGQVGGKVPHHEIGFFVVESVSTTSTPRGCRISRTGSDPRGWNISHIRCNPGAEQEETASLGRCCEKRLPVATGFKAAAM